MKYTEEQQQVSKYARALSHPARVAIMEFLARQRNCYFGEINTELPIAKATVSQHLAILKEVGLIQGTIEAPKVKYCINRSNWLLAQNLLQDFFRNNFPTQGCCSTHIVIERNDKE